MLEREREREKEGQKSQPWFLMREELRRTRQQPRVIKKADRQTYDIGGGQMFTPITYRGTWQVLPDPDVPLCTFVAWTTEIAPLQGDGQTRGHSHQNEAVFYILEGKGYEVHDNVRYAWEAGDVVIVHAGCVHAHFSVGDKPAKALVINPKPVYMHLNLKEQAPRA